MKECRFNVFGTLVALVGTDGRWQAFYPGNDGKRRPADFIVPAGTKEDDLVEYLADLFHEDATPKRNEVIRVS